MSILINMAMPKECKDCPIYNGEYLRCNITNTEPWQGHEDDDVVPIPSDCPLIELPPHGDLIDRDKLETHHGWYNEDRERNVVQTHIQFVYANAILTAPVVVESEE